MSAFDPKRTFAGRLEVVADELVAIDGSESAACPKGESPWPDEAPNSSYSPGGGGEIKVAAHKASDELAISLAHLPPTLAQRRFALVVVVFQFVVCAVVAPFPALVPRIDSFVPVILAVIFVADLITAVLLFNQSSVIASRALLVLANGYLFSALIVIPHALTFPGAFAPKGLLGAGVSSSGWLNVFWHFGFLVAVAGYACLKGGERRNDAHIPSGLSAFYWSAAIQISLVCALTWAVTAGERFMPRLFLDDLSYAPLIYYATGMLVLMSVLVLLLMWTRRTSVLDLWLMVAICMVISEMALVAAGMTVRFYLGWYVSRTLAVAVSTVVLIALLSESMRLHAALSRANLMLERERKNRLMNVKAATSSIVHEVRQPLAVITASAAAARKWLEKVPPDVGEVKPLLENIERAGLRAGEVLANVPRLFEDADHEQQPVDVNNLALETLKILHGELHNHAVKTNIELASELPPVMGHRVQLGEVILNLVRNAIDAMDSNNVDRRTLEVRTKPNGAKAIIMEVEDSGPGIEAERLGGIFEAFVTTKPHGMGLGLAICSRIIERHGGRLTASSDGKNGALFQIVLPVEPMYKAAGPAE
jgi:signal transduction histidine kinase